MVSATFTMPVSAKVLALFETEDAFAAYIQRKMERKFLDAIRRDIDELYLTAGPAMDRLPPLQGMKP